LATARELPASSLACWAFSENVESLRGVLAQPVHRGGQIAHETLLPFERDTPREVAGDGGIDYLVDFLLDRLFGRLVPPFDDGTGALAVLVLI
jgi:hypothetical protein